LVISEEDLQNSIGVIRQALVDLDQVRGFLPATTFTLPSQTNLLIRPEFHSLQLEDIPGEVESEKGFRDELTN
jgi:hypothetical protein